MPAQLIDGKKLAEYVKDDLVAEIMDLTVRPNLAIILVGDRLDSSLYVKLKEREGKKVGVDTHLYKFEATASEAEVLACIDFLNRDATIDGILIQLPLPDGFDEDTIVRAMDPAKDVDGFHPQNLKKIAAGDTTAITPPLANVVLEMLDSINVPIPGSQLALVAKSDIFMAGVGDVLTAAGGHVIACHPDDPDLARKTKTADIIVTAVGKKHYLTEEYVKAGAAIIDIGIIQEGGETYGDVDWASVQKVASYVSPVPGGVGPMTIAFAFKNVLTLYKRNRRPD